jgi:hypothetical protein
VLPGKQFEEKAEHKKFRVRDTLGVIGATAAIVTSGTGITQTDLSVEGYWGQSRLRSEGLQRSAERNNATRNRGFDDISAGG